MHRARKRFGQNFLHDHVIINQMLSLFNVQSTDNVLEIGPGLGALTGPLLDQLGQLTVIEIDTDLQAYLKQKYANKNLTIIAGDALSLEYSTFGERLRIIGNLPYNISTPLLLHLLRYIPYIRDMHFMLQKEVVQRIIAIPGSKDYGRLSIMIQYHCQAVFLLDVSPEAFHPRPKVNSAVVRLLPYHQSPFMEVSVEQLECLTALAFSMRRKTLANNLKSKINIQAIIGLGIDPTLRPEDITVGDYVRLANLIG